MGSKSFAELADRLDARLWPRRRSVREALLKRDGRCCFVCKLRFLSILNCHHIKPVAKGGEGLFHNLVLLCPNCHALVHSCHGPIKRKEMSAKMLHERLIFKASMQELGARNIILLSTEAVLINSDGIAPRQSVYPDETFPYPEFYELFNWWPEI